MKQTAVEWLEYQLENIVELYPSEWEKINNAINQAKAMEKEQIKNAYRTRYIKRWNNFNAEQYYNETFKSE